MQKECVEYDLRIKQNDGNKIKFLYSLSISEFLNLSKKLTNHLLYKGLHYRGETLFFYISYPLLKDYK